MHRFVLLFAACSSAGSAPLANAEPHESNAFTDQVALSASAILRCYRQVHATGELTITLAFSPDDSYSISWTPGLGASVGDCLGSIVQRWHVRRWKLAKRTYVARLQP